jgi:3-oxoacyl-[acyl-carrier protein] reductase
VDLGLAGKAALVGGGSQGLGRATAEALAREGTSVAIYARSEEALRRAAEEIEGATGTEVVAVAADVRSAGDCEGAVARAVAAFGRLDVLVVNTGGPPYGAPLPQSDEEWTEAWRTWALSSIRLSRLAVPHMRAAGGGSIIGITSCGVHQQIPETALSEVPRLAATGFAKHLATELAPENIRVNNVLPGWMETSRADARLAGEAARRGLSEDDVRAEEEAMLPMGRYGTPEDVGSAVAFLASDRAAYITGVNLRVDGGWCLNPIF